MTPRRAVTAMVIPLAVIAVTMFVAVLVPYGYPLKWITVADVPDLSPFLATHIGALVLAVLLGISARRDKPPGALPTIVALLAILGPTFMTAWAVKVFNDAGMWTPILVFLGPLTISLVLAFNALRGRGWERMWMLLGAYAIAALPFSCPIVPGMFNLFSGGLVYLAAVITILGLFVRGFRGPAD